MQGMILVGVVLSTFLWGGGSAALAASTSSEGPGRCGSFDHGHKAWTAILGRYVTLGDVDYAGLHAAGQGDLERYLTSLKTVCKDDYSAWSREQKLAYWINAYNAFMIRLVLDNYPVSSIRSIGLLPGSVFRKSFISIPAFQKDLLSLNDIEHKFIRDTFDEPRIHFAIVCASKSCPALRSEAYRADALERQLDEAARLFLADSSRNWADLSTGALYLSHIFKWYSDDFTKKAGGIPNFIGPYAPPGMALLIRKGVRDVRFVDYDWSLNGR